MRGRRLAAPRSGVRPTQDRVREALFSILAGRVAGAAFLDLFAGTGAVGIEAHSRGAARVVWVESGRRALQYLRRNVADLCGGGTVVAADVRGALRRGLPGGPFDLVFADPPYGTLDRRERLLDALGGAGVVAGEGLVVVEQAAGEAAPAAASWSLTDERTYGETCLRFYAREKQ